jgi:hypothetical protein
MLIMTSAPMRYAGPFSLTWLTASGLRRLRPESGLSQGDDDRVDEAVQATEHGPTKIIARSGI